MPDLITNKYIINYPIIFFNFKKLIFETFTPF